MGKLDLLKAKLAKILLSLSNVKTDKGILEYEADELEVGVDVFATDENGERKPIEDGEYTSKPIKTSYGYHIILKVSSTPVEEYKDVKEDVKKSYAESLLNEDSTLFAAKWDELRKEYKLSIKDDIIKKAYKKTVEEATKVEETEE